MDSTFDNRKIYTKKIDDLNNNAGLLKASFVAVVSVHLFTIGNNNISVSRNNESNPSNSDSITITRNSGTRGGIQMSSGEVSEKDLERLEETTKNDLNSLEKLINEKFSHTNTKIENAVNHTDTKIENAINELKAEIEKSRSSNRRWAFALIVTIILTIFF